MTDAPRTGIYPRQTLTEGEIAEIRVLADACLQRDELDLRLLWEVLQSRSGETANDFLHYVDGELVGFLTIEGVGDEDAEATGMVHPAHRRRGVFGALVEAAKSECRRNATPAIVFYCDRRSQPAKAFLESIGATYQFSEHKMRLDTPGAAEAPATELSITRAGPEDAADIAAVLAEDMGLQATGFAQHIADNMRRPTYTYYIARLGETAVGTANLQILDQRPYIYGFVVRPEYRGRGYGRQILAHMIAGISAAQPEPVFLEVEQDNTPALGLYRSFGFEPVATFDYYRVNISESADNADSRG